MGMLVNDMYGSRRRAKLITKSALVVLSLFNKENKVSNLKNGMVVNFSGMSKTKFNETSKLLNDKGFELKSTGENGHYTLNKKSE